MTVKFVLLNNDGNTLKEYELEFSNKFIDLKLQIVKDHYEGKGTVNINLLLDRAKRIFGKFNLEPGSLPNSFDNKQLEDFAFKENDIINIKVVYSEEAIDNLVEESKTKNKFSSGKYVPPHKKRTPKTSTNSFYNSNRKNDEVKKEFVFNADDFPAL